MQINVHIGIFGDNASITKELTFSHVPRVGEYFASSPSREAVVYRVLDVVHFPFGHGWDAEIYAVEVDRKEAEKRYVEAHRHRKEKVITPQVW